MFEQSIKDISTGTYLDDSKVVARLVGAVDALYPDQPWDVIRKIKAKLSFI